MERCTEWRGEHAAVTVNTVNYIDRLARYEDTDLEPDEIQEAVDLVTFSGADIPQELKRWVERCTWHVRKCAQLGEELDRAKKELAELRSKLKDKWISVEDELPEIKEHHVSDEVLVWCAEDEVMAFSDLEETVCGYIFGIERASPDGEDTPEVTHWMPTPEPPKEGSDEREEET